MKILYVITGLGVGGAERQVLDLADRLSAQGHLVKVAYLTGPLLLKPTESNIELIPLAIEKSLASVLRGFQALRVLIKRFQPDVVHSHMFHANLLARLVRSLTGMSKLICTAHNTYEGGRLRMLAYRLTDRLADLSTNVSLEAVKAFEGMGAVPRGRMVPVVNGIDTQKHKFDSGDRKAYRNKSGLSSKLVLAVGRLFEAKDYPNLLRAFSFVADSDKGVSLWIVGQGPLHVSLVALAEKLGISSRVTFLGVRHDVPQLMSAADIFVLSSAWEGFSLVVAEAMATERVIVATDCGGVKDVVGDCGFLVPPKDPQRLASALKVALSLSPDEAKILGAKARRRISEKYSFDVVTRRWLDLYKG